MGGSTRVRSVEEHGFQRGAGVPDDGGGEFALVVIGAGPPTLACGRGLNENLVVDIGHITHKSDFVAELQKPAAHDVERHGGTDMANMR